MASAQCIEEEKLNVYCKGTTKGRQWSAEEVNRGAWVKR